MPIYAYRCAACGHAQDVLQKLSDPLLTVCPACGAAAYTKQVTAAGFQLKGSGWYVTDFKNGSARTEAKPEPGGEKAADAAADKGADKTTDGGEAKVGGKAPETPAGRPSGDGAGQQAARAPAEPGKGGGSGGSGEKASPAPAAAAPAAPPPAPSAG